MSYYKLCEKAFAIFGLMFFTGTISDVVVPESIVSLSRYLILMFSIIFIGLRYQSAIKSLRKDPFLIILIALTFASVLWSVSPGITALSLRSQFIQMVGFALFFATSFTLREQLELIGISFGISVLLNSFYAIAQPSIGRHTSGQFAGAWKGIYTQKNTLSRLMVLACIAFTCLNDKSRSKRYIPLLGIAFSLGLVFMTTSKSGILSSIVLIAFLFFYRRFRWRGETTLIALDLSVLILVFSISVLIENWEPLLVGLGRDPTMSGRTLIWQASLNLLFRDHFWLGFGRDAFWSTPQYPIEIGASVARGYIPPHGHNGFVDLALDVGVIGIFVFGLSLIHNLVRVAKLAYAAQKGEHLWPFAFLTCLFIANITESSLMRLTDVFGVLYMAIAFSNLAGQTEPIETPQSDLAYISEV